MQDTALESDPCESDGVLQHKTTTKACRAPKNKPPLLQDNLTRLTVRLAESQRQLPPSEGRKGETKQERGASLLQMQKQPDDSCRSAHAFTHGRNPSPPAALRANDLAEGHKPTRHPTGETCTPTFHPSLLISIDPASLKPTASLLQQSWKSL